MSYHQYHLITGDTVETYLSQTEAAEAVGVHQVNISNCCRGRQTEAGGFGWRYLSEDRQKAVNIDANEEEEEEEDEGK
jgi:hypothetical protein